MASNYWATVTRARVARRRVLRAGAGFGVVAAALSFIGCGGDDDDGGPTGAATGATGTTGTTGTTGATGATGPAATAAPTGLVSPPVDTTSDAVPGGTYIGQADADPTTFDVITGLPEDVAMAARVYSRLIKYKSYKYPEPVEPAAEPDAAVSWETSGDGTQVTYKVRPNFRYDPRPPTNGRAMTSADMKFSFDRFMEQSTQRSVFDNSVSPDAPVLNTEAPDDETFVVNLAFPYAPFDMLIAAWRFVVVMPVEAADQYDVKNAVFGTGAWRLQNAQVSSRYEYVKNPDWYDADKNNLEALHFVIMPDAATAQAQFLAGNLWWWVDFPQDQMIGFKKDMPELIMQAREFYNAGGIWIRFGYMPDSPYLDERVRKAVSMSLDRDTFIDTFGNVEGYAAEGIEVPRRWNSAIPAGEDFWIDPLDDDYGESVAFLQYNLDEATKLMEAAGVQTPLQSSFHWPSGQFGPIHNQKQEVHHAMWQDSGLFSLTQNSYPNYIAEFQTPFTNGGGQWDGIASATTAARPEVDTLLYEYYKSNDRRAGHIMPNGQPDTELDALVEKQRATLDRQERGAIIADIQRHVTSKMYLLWEPGQTLGFDLIQPWLQNFGLWRSKSGGSQDQEGRIYWWYDQSKA
jgi:peptide/nickel transport system substrate-binding protein